MCVKDYSGVSIMPENSAIETPHSSHSTHTCFFDFAKNHVRCNKKNNCDCKNKKITVRHVRRATTLRGRDSRSFKPYYSHSTRTIRTTVTSFFSFSILASFGHLIAAVLLGPVQSCVHSLFELFTALAALKFCNPDTHRQPPSIRQHTGVLNRFADAFRQSSHIMEARQRQ